MGREYYVVDAFSSEPFGGNPAAVVLNAGGLDDASMQAIAAEFNLSETTFVLPPNGSDCDAGAAVDLSVRFRWFTPTMEVRMCGHATIAGVWALLQVGRLVLPEDQASVSVGIDTLSGRLTAFVERSPTGDGPEMIWLDLIDPSLAPCPLDGAALANVLGIQEDALDVSLPPVQSQDGDALVFVREWTALHDARPEFNALGALLEGHGLRGLSLATVNTLTPSVNVESRFFAPPAGVDEDPVTGSVHGPLAAYLVQQGRVAVHEGLAAVTCVQSQAGGRAGLLYALVEPKAGGGHAVRIGGHAVTVMRGELSV